MRYLDLILERPLIWGLFLFYLVATSALAYMGHRKTKDLRSFAVGGGDMNPVVVGITLAASIASTATFVINPGFVYVHGLSALMHLGVAAGLGVIAGLVIMSVGFRRIGQRTSALTLPSWVGQRYQSVAMTVFFAAVNLLSLTFVVLIVAGLSIVMQRTLGLTHVESLLLVIGFVFSYIFVGGTYAHAYTNTLQGAMMVVIASIIVLSGVQTLFGGDVMAKLASVDPNLVKTINPASDLYGTFFSVWISGFVIGFAVVSQPHIMIKALYVKDDRDVWRYLAVCIGVSLIFTALLLVGLYAHLMDIPREAFLHPTTKAFSQDAVMTVYITQTFSPWMIAIIMVALMAAGMSTLDGILLALSSIVANDLFLNLTRGNLLASRTPDEQLKAAHRFGQLVLILMGVATFFIALDPPKLLGIFGQLGVYGIVAASIVPILGGIVFAQLSRVVAFTSAVAALVVHFGLYALGQLAPEAVAGMSFANPGVTATYGILVSAAIALPAALLARAKAQQPPAQDAPAQDA